MNTAGLYPVIIILTVNSLLAILIFAASFFQKAEQRSTAVLLSWFIFIVPLIGAVYLLLSFMINYFIRNQNVDMSDVSFSQEREKLILPPDISAEMNYVPIHDAIAISDTASLRRILLNTMLSNVKNKISSIAAAMNSQDTETSHYVATMVMDVLSELRSAAQDMIEKMQKIPEDVEMNLLTFDYIYEFLSLKILSGVEQEAYIFTLDDVAENLFTYNLWYMTATHYLRMTDMFISIRNFSMAEKWSSRAGQYRPDMLDTYKAKLHLFFEQHHYSAFYKCLNELVSSQITADNEVAELMQMYIEQR